MQLPIPFHALRSCWKFPAYGCSIFVDRFNEKACVWERGQVWSYIGEMFPDLRSEMVSNLRIAHDV